jgi:hypothetical protein
MSPTRRLAASGLVIVGSALAFWSAVGGVAFQATAQAGAPTAPDLGTAKAFSVVGHETVTNTGPSVLGQSVGVYPGTAITGFPPGIVLPPATSHAADAVAQNALADAGAAYTTAAGLPPDETEPPGTDLVGRTLNGGVYKAASTMAVGGTVTLDGQDDPASVWVFQVGSGLNVASDTNIALVNGASACNIYWQVGSDAVIDTSTLSATTRAFRGNVIASGSVTVRTGTRVEGRAFALTGQVSLDTNTFTAPDCSTGGGSSSSAPGSSAPGSSGPGSSGPGSSGPGSTGPGSSGPGSTGPGSTGSGTGVAVTSAPVLAPPVLAPPISSRAFVPPAGLTGDSAPRGGNGDPLLWGAALLCIMGSLLLIVVRSPR